MLRNMAFTLKKRFPDSNLLLDFATGGGRNCGVPPAECRRILCVI